MPEYMIEGYVIIPPVPEWDAKHKDKIIPEMSYGTFAKRPNEAWAKKIGRTLSDIDRPIRIQAFHDRGYRLRKAKMIIIDEEG